MSSPLVYSSAQLLEDTSKWYLYPHIIYFCPRTKSWISVGYNKWKLLPFYFVNIFLVFGLGFLPSLHQILKYIYGTSTRISGEMAMLQAFLMMGTLFGWSLNFPAFQNANRMVGYMNAIVAFEGKLFKQDIVLSPAIGISKVFAEIPSMLYKEFIKLLQGKNPDYLGVFQVLFVLYFQLITFIGPPIAIYLNIDPCFFLFQDFGFYNKYNQPIWIILLRLLIGWLCLAECLRTMCLIVNPLLLEHCILNKIVKRLKRMRMDFHVLELYQQLCVINFGGDDMTSYAFSMTMGSAFFIGVMLTSCLFVGWKLFPWTIYICSVPTAFIVHFAIYIIFPLMADGHIESKITIRNIWPVKCSESILSANSRLEIRKWLAAFRPISFKTVVTREEVDRNFRRSYTANIMFKTLDLLLLSK